MKIIDRRNIDVAKWDALVDRTTGAGFFSYSWYLDATAEEWCALIDDDYSFGIALPFTKRLGVEFLYTPVFVRYIEVLGDKKRMVEASPIIIERFQNRDIAVKQKLFGVGYKEFVFQTIDSKTERNIGSQAKRMLKKARSNKLDITINNDCSNILNIVKSELSGKFKGINKSSLITLEKLFEAAKKHNALSAFNVNNPDNYEAGGIVCLEKNDTILYLKGAVESENKKNGGMYLALNESIEFALNNSKSFDFGGSRISGVKQFNHNLGGTDQVYYGYKVDNAPFWFKLARRIKNTWSKK